MHFSALPKRIILFPINFNNADCILEIKPPTISSGSSKKRRVLNGWAEGKMEIYIQIDSTYSITKGKFKNGTFINGTIKDFFSNGKVEQILTYKKTQPSNLVQYDENGTVINLYDFVIKE